MLETNEHEKTDIGVEEKERDIKQDDAWKEKIGSVFQYSNASIRTYTSDVSFKTLMQGIEDGLYEIPAFQRFYKWSIEQAEELATSLVRGMPIPPIYVYRTEEGILRILDGQQRIISLFLYYKGVSKSNRAVIDFRNKDICKSIEDSKKFIKHEYFMHFYKDSVDDGLEEESVSICYCQLPVATKRIVDYRTITVVEIQMDDAKYRRNNLFKIFANLNSGGTPLSPQELRNGLYGCKFYSMLFDINYGNERWIGNNGGPNKDSKDVELLLRFCALSDRTVYDDKNRKFRVKPFKKYITMLNDFSEKSTSFDDKTIDLYRGLLECFIEKYSLTYKDSIALCEATFVVTKLFPSLLDSITYVKLTEILKSNKFRDTTVGGTTNASRIEERLEAVYSELS